MKYSGILISIFLISLLLIATQLIRTKSTFGSNSDTCVLLTTTVYINTDYLNKDNTPKARLNVYNNCIKEWLNNTNLTIYIVESSNYSFPEFKNNPRVKVFTFKSSNNIKCQYCSATPFEAESIKLAFNHFKLYNYTNIIKVTGKYYIPGIEELIKNIPSNSEIFYQYSSDRGSQNSEIFGCKTMYLEKIMDKIIENSKVNKNFETTIYGLSDEYIVYRFPPIKLNTPVKRSGDGKLMYYL